MPEVRGRREKEGKGLQGAENQRGLRYYPFSDENYRNPMIYDIDVALPAGQRTNPLSFLFCFCA
jgi:hypothetical protein